MVGIGSTKVDDKSIRKYSGALATGAQLKGAM